MHVVLMILKIIGIILLVILGILLLLLLLLLFVPMRYRLHVKRDAQTLEADGRMTWLLHLLRADMTVRDMHGTAVIKVFGFKIKTFHFLKKEDAPEEDFSQDQAQEPSKAQNLGSEPEALAKEPDQGSEPEALAKKPDQGAEPEPLAKAPDQSAGPKPPEERIADSGISGEETGTKTAREMKKDSRNRSETAKKNNDSGSGIIGKILNLVERLLNIVLNLLMQVPGLPAELHDRIDIALQKLQKKSDAFHKKIDPFLSIEAEHMLGKMIRYLKYLARGYAPRKISGYIHFGTGAPDLTGILTGLIYMLLPESGTEYDVDPDFYEAVLETDTEMKGHIRAYRLIWVALRLLLDKEFRILFARIRGKEKVKAHRGSRRARKKAAMEAQKKAA